ncbi:MAG: hypothetical protein Q7U04_11345 [Bacteriovorax sp.]|nr:hypothetical protein [Bacteriovorax sp.]
MRKSITVSGKASGKTIKTILIPNDLPSNISLMHFLIDNGITVASSCGGVGSCKKCLINRSLLSCQITLEEFMATSILGHVEISYL